ncbi:DUF262 domain-containing protein [Vibrio parahaemolyticus]|uniref:DUF262 domain-containing protein n=1 Tax=Vibrio parahaemolyticus TaxID=670 RepID=UPI0007A03EE1|nr:DUF262 domain-containing protein [Vibrio parahaemolyticus]EGQ7740045.1 DUF262 domain-containing protein [Vibrio parahaemolyticus]EGR1765858.1 DUF262 domain-containing protein [Vibrio parahaemolyticus]EHD0106490.1 DUF262 domain-containing protein [Vibrio parahaemolyticus]EIO3963843.1 DUF262 domain-containing protein [Vibrio parahaemolyticus]EIO3986927.1 DUF262 domain-containing protein [Vibrio parahaemolyticus]
MKFEDVLGYLEQMVGLKLQPINDSNEALVILEVDRENSRYTVDKTSSTRKRTRPFIELQKILSALNQKGFTSVDQALGGAGSSRHQPETIFANLPCVEHFKYEKKKHLYLRDTNTHELGSIKQLTTSESREIKRRIDRYRDFDVSQFYDLHREQTLQLKNKLDSIFTKYPGESDVDAVKDIVEKIQELEIRLSEAIVSIDQSEGQSSSTSIDDDSIPFGGDQIDDNDDSNDEQGTVDPDVAIVKGLIPTRITQVSPTVSLLYDRVLHNEIDLTPEYQRKDRIWPLKDRARLIESILLGLPLPVFYFAERANKDAESEVDFDWVVIDGLQRTTTLVDFVQGRFALKDLNQLPKYNTFYFKDLPRKEQRKIREYQIHGHLIQVSNDSEEMIRELFHRINTYGKNLSYQEIRSALYPGSTSRFCKYFSAENIFLDSIPAKVSDERMLDVEYVLRAISYIVLGYENYFYKTNDDFLCHTMKVLNDFNYDKDKGLSASDEIFQVIDYKLRESLKTISLIFEDDAFKKEPKGKLNKVLFELLVSMFGMMSEEQRELMINSENSERFKASLWEAILKDANTSEWESDTYAVQDRGFDYSITNSTGKRVTVLYRFRSLVNLLNQVPGMNFTPKGMLENKNVVVSSSND